MKPNKLLILITLNILSMGNISAMDPVCKEIKNLKPNDPKFAYISTAKKLQESRLSLCDCMKQITNENFNKVYRLLDLPTNERINLNLKINISEVECPPYGPSHGLVRPDRQTESLCSVVKDLFNNQHENPDLTIPLKFKIDNSQSSAMGLKFYSALNTVKAKLTLNKNEALDFNELISLLKHEKAHLDKLHTIERIYIYREMAEGFSNDSHKFDYVFYKLQRQQEKEADFLSRCDDEESTHGAISYFERKFKKDQPPIHDNYKFNTVIEEKGKFGFNSSHPPKEKRLEWAKKINRLQKTINNL